MCKKYSTSFAFASFSVILTLNLAPCSAAAHAWSVHLSDPHPRWALGRWWPYFCSLPGAMPLALQPDHGDDDPLVQFLSLGCSCICRAGNGKVQMPYSKSVLVIFSFHSVATLPSALPRHSGIPPQLNFSFQSVQWHTRVFVSILENEISSTLDLVRGIKRVFKNCHEK